MTLQGTIEIPLTRGFAAIVDEADYKELSKYKWFEHEGYAARNVYLGKNKRTTIRMHTQMLGKVDGMTIDHINGNGLNNRRANLRRVTYSQNQQNRTPGCKKTTSKYKGVYWFKIQRKWKAVIKKDGKQIGLGYFKNEENAARAYNTAALKMFGEFARINYILEGKAE